jgi:hypothetical protein
MNKRLKIEVEQNDAGEVVATFTMRGQGADLAILLASAIMSQQNDEDKSRIIAVLTTATEPLTLMAASLGISNIDYVYDKRRDG